MNCHDENIQNIINKMTIIHENSGHYHPRDMVKMCDAYTPSRLGYTKTEAITYLKYWESCDRLPCEEELFEGSKIAKEKLCISNE